MPKRKTGSKKKPAAIKPRVLKHIKAIGFEDTEDYLYWCLDNGFDNTLDKSVYDCTEELERNAFLEARSSRRARVHANPKKIIRRACAGELHAGDIERPEWDGLLAGIDACRNKKSLCELLCTVIDRADFLFDNISFGGAAYPYLDALIRINDRQGQWRQPLNDWRPGIHNHRRQFASLVRHLLADYPVPLFMDSVWFRDEPGSHRLRDWFTHIGAGRNIKTAKLPIPLSKRMAHFFIRSPHDYSVENAFYWGQVHAEGGDKRLADMIVTSQIGNRLGNNKFWLSVIRFFVANPMLDRRHIGPIIDFLQYHKFEPREVENMEGEIVMLPPPQPNLTLRGRTVQTLLRHVEEWHRQLARYQHAGIGRFPPTDIKPFRFDDPRKKESFWQIRRLRTPDALIVEGEEMNHCVATYAYSCEQGHCTIWSMEQVTPKARKKLQTIEVNAKKVIVQSRGFANRWATGSEYRFLRQWAAKEALSISPYIVFDN